MVDSRLEVFRFSNPQHYRDMIWDGVSCVEIIWENSYPIRTRYGYRRPRLCKFKCGYGPDLLLCKRHANLYFQRVELMQMAQDRWNDIVEGNVKTYELPAITGRSGSETLSYKA